MIRVAPEPLGAIDRGEREGPRRLDAVGHLNAERGQLHLELLDQSIEHRLEVAPQVEAVGLVTSDARDGAGHDPRGLHAAQRLRVQERAIGEPGGDQALQIVVGGVAIFREAAPVLERQVGAIKGDRIRERDERRDEDHHHGREARSGRAPAKHGGTA